MALAWMPCSLVLQECGSQGWGRSQGQVFVLTPGFVSSLILAAAICKVSRVHRWWALSQRPVVYSTGVGETGGDSR